MELLLFLIFIFSSHTKAIAGHLGAKCLISRDIIYAFAQADDKWQILIHIYLRELCLQPSGQRACLLPNDPSSNPAEVYSFSLCGQAVSGLAFYPDDPSSNPAEVYSFILNNVWKNENIEKDAGVGPFLNKKNLISLWRLSNGQPC